MMRYRRRRRTSLSWVLFLILLVGVSRACERRNPPATESAGRVSREADDTAPYQAEVEEGLGAAVAILIDTSGSMRETAPGDSRPKYIVAREAIEAMLDATDAFVAKRPDFPVKIGIYNFSSDASVQLPIQPYNRAAIRTALDHVPRPGGGTAIGAAMREARPDLYRAGVFRKYILVVTDGENTSGQTPDVVAREIWKKSEGAVQMYFVAFDTRPEKFVFLKETGGDVLGAGNAAELRTALDGVYQGKILAEALDAGEREPVKKQ